MRGSREERIEAAVDRLAAAVLAAATGYCGFVLLRGAMPAGQLVAASAASGGLAYLVAATVLRRVPAHRRRFAVPVFEVRDPGLRDQWDELLLTEQVELELTDAERLPTDQPSSDELLLDDILASLGPDSRVVRLFDRAAMPTPAQLNARIERHLRDAPAARTPDTAPDASHALHEALAELRRSLR